MSIVWDTKTERDFFFARLLAKQGPPGSNASEAEWNEVARIMGDLGYENLTGEPLRYVKLIFLLSLATYSLYLLTHPTPIYSPYNAHMREMFRNPAKDNEAT
jgi:hypothetical protein